VWKVATTGERDASVANQLTAGALGSCTCTTSKRPARSSRPTAATASVDTARFETAPFIGSPTVRPTGIR
jgi:hypothetical protein